VLVDLERWLAGPPSEQDGRHPLPRPEVFAEGMARAGIGDDDVVVAFDDSEGVVAARLVWMLRVTGTGPRCSTGQPVADEWREQGALERDNGGRPARELHTAPVASGAAGRPRRRPGPRPGCGWTPGLATATPAGRTPSTRAPGTCPAPELPCRDHVDAEACSARRGPAGPAGGRRRRGGDAGGLQLRSGVTACHTLLVLEHLGLPPGRLYPGSWSQYAADPDRPVELGPDRR
jgi:thiosulfate/3-mercaptopyruvate sulfurtransferase